MSAFTLKSKENRLQKPPTVTNSSVPRRSACVGTTTSTTTNHRAIPLLRRSVPNSTINKTPDLLHPPKFGGQQSINRKPDITKNLPNKVVQKPSQPVAEKLKLVVFLSQLIILFNI